MKRILIFILCLMCGTCLLAVAAENTFQQVKTFTLDNGMKVWINEDHTQPKVFGAVVVRAGAIDCPNTGIAHYFEHILFKGTDKLGTTDYNAEKPILDSIAVLYDELGKTADNTQRLSIQKEINNLSRKGMQYTIPNEFSSLTSRLGGTGLNAATSYDFTYYHNVFSPQYINEWLDLNSHRLIHPVFRLFQNELETVYEEKNMYSDKMLSAALEHAFGDVMKGTPYAYPIIGSTENLKNPSLSDMQKFYDKYYVANNMGLIFCGDVNAEEILPQIQKTFGRIRRGDVPQRPAITMQEFNGQNSTIKLNIPLVTCIARIYKAPGKGTREALAMSLATGLLTNESGCGLVDSLMNNGKILGGIVHQKHFKDEGLIMMIAIPNLFGKKAKAENLLLQQIEKLKQGWFSIEVLNALKLEKVNSWKKSLETISSRSDVLVDVFANYDITWQEYLDLQNQIGTITKEEVMDVCKKYFGDSNYYHLTKKMGSYPKDRLSQPGYHPLASKNIDRKSEFAQHIDSLANETAFKPRLIDFRNDVQKTEISPLQRVYAVRNPQNDIFNLSLIFRKGTEEDPRLQPVMNYVSALGTEKHSKQEFNTVLQHIGATLEMETGKFSTIFTLTGLDSHLDETLGLLKEMLECPKADSKQYKTLLDMLKTDEKVFDKEGSQIANLLTQKIALGDSSSYLTRTTFKEVKKMKEQKLLDIYHDLQHMECDIIYSGSLSAEDLSSKVRDILKLDISEKNTPYDYFKQYSEPIVYFVNKKGSRQTIVGTYSLLSQPQDDKGLATLDVWASYFGGDMSSVLFQEIREMRSMAYSVWGNLDRYGFRERYKAPAQYFTRMSTQADKTLDAMAVMDTLWTDMPLRKENIEVAKIGIISQINNTFPNFRGMPYSIANDEWLHYPADTNTYRAQNVPSVTPEDVQTLWRNNIRTANRVWYVVGDKKKIDMNTLSRFGRVIELKTSELFKK